jgi:hypothetical protein
LPLRVKPVLPNQLIVDAFVSSEVHNTADEYLVDGI